MPRYKDQDGYEVKCREDFVSKATYRHYIAAYRKIDARPLADHQSRAMIVRGIPVSSEGGDVLCALGLIKRQAAVGLSVERLHEVRTHLAICLRALEDDPVRFDRFRWFKRNLYKALRYRRGHVCAEAILDFIDDWLIKILETENPFIPAPRQLTRELAVYGEKYGQ